MMASSPQLRFGVQSPLQLPLLLLLPGDGRARHVFLGSTLAHKDCGCSKPEWKRNMQRDVRFVWLFQPEHLIPYFQINFHFLYSSDCHRVGRERSPTFSTGTSPRQCAQLHVPRVLELVLRMKEETPACPIHLQAQAAGRGVSLNLWLLLILSSCSDLQLSRHLINKSMPSYWANALTLSFGRCSSSPLRSLTEPLSPLPSKLCPVVDPTSDRWNFWRGSPGTSRERSFFEYVRMGELCSAILPVISDLSWKVSWLFRVRELLEYNRESRSRFVLGVIGEARSQLAWEFDRTESDR